MTKAAALLHSLARNQWTATSGSAWLATYVFLAKNGMELDPNDDDAYALVVGVASGEISDVAEIASALGAWAK